MGINSKMRDIRNAVEKVSEDIIKESKIIKDCTVIITGIIGCVAIVFMSCDISKTIKNNKLVDAEIEAINKNIKRVAL